MRLPALLLLAALGAAARAEDAAVPTEQDACRQFYEDIYEPFFVKDEAAGVYRSRRAGGRESEFRLHKSSGTVRVFLIGGDPGGAARDLARADALAPGRPRILTLRAIAEALGGRTAAARRCLMEARRSGGDRVEMETLARGLGLPAS